MLPVLLKLGPWDYSALPLIFAVVLGLLLLWQWLEWRYGGGRRPDLKRASLSALLAAVLSAVVYLAVNRVAPLEIKAWGTMLVVAFSAGTLFMARYGDRKVLLPAEALDMSLFALIGAVVGARVIFVALDWQTYAGQPVKLLNVWEGGLSFHGGLLGAVLAGLLFAHLRHKRFWELADQAAPGIALGYAFARVGCFLNGCCHGHACHLPWAMRFPHGELPNELVHPTQLYALLASLAIFAVLIRLRGSFPRAGHLFGTYLAIYSVARFLLEFTRAGATGKLLTTLPWLTVAQLASIIIFAVSVAAIALTWTRPAPAVPEPASEPLPATRKRRKRKH